MPILVINSNYTEILPFLQLKMLNLTKQFTNIPFIYVLQTFLGASFAILWPWSFFVRKKCPQKMLRARILIL